MNHDTSLMTRFSESAHLLHGDTLFYSRQNILISAFVADQEQSQTRIFERFYRVIIKVRPAVTTPGQTQSGKFLCDFTSAREVGCESVVIKEKLRHLGKELFHVGHFVGDILGRAHAVLVPA